MRFHPRGNPARRSKNKLGRAKVPLSCEALEERRMLSGTEFSLASALVGSPSPTTITPVLTEELGVGTQWTSVTMDAQGNYIVAWVAQNFDSTSGRGEALMLQRYNGAGEAQGAAIVVAYPSDGSAISLPKVAFAENGDFLVAWQSTNWTVSHNSISPSTIHVNKFAADGQFLDVLVEESADWSLLSGLAVGHQGEFIVSQTDTHVWPFLRPEDQPRESGPTASVRRYAADGTPLDWSHSFGLSSGAEVAVLDDDSFVIAWIDGERDDGAILIQQFSAAGDPLSNPARVNPLGSRGLGFDLAASSLGGFVVTWSQAEGEGREIFAQRFTASANVLGPAIHVSESDETQSLSPPVLAMASNGNFAIGWTAVAPQQTPLRVRAFFADGTSITDVLAAGNRNTSYISIGLAFGTTGNLVTTWLIAPRVGSQDGSATPDSYALSEVKVVRQQYVIPIPLAIDLNGDPPGVDYKVNFVPGGASAPIGDSQNLLVRGSNSITLVSATVTIAGYLPGDLPTLDVTRPGIAASFANGVLTLSGLDTVANYQEVLRDLKFSTTAARAVGSTVEIGVVVSDGTLTSAAATSKISIHIPGRSSIAGRQIFYNNSGFDGNDPAANAGDHAAIATDKSALLPNQTATFANYTSYTRGINGIFVDLAGGHGTISADDFIFRIGNSNDPAHWAYAPQPLSVVVRPGAGIGGADRVEIVWADGVIKNAWLQVIVLDNGDTGLAAADVFMFGNQVGEAGNEPGDTQVGMADVMRVVNRLLAGGDKTAPVDSAIDFNRDGQITMADLMAALNHVLADDPQLALIRIGGASALDGAIITGGLIATMVPPVQWNVIESPGVQLQSAGSEYFQPAEVDLHSIALQSAATGQLMLDPNAQG